MDCIRIGIIQPYIKTNSFGVRNRKVNIQKVKSMINQLVEDEMAIDMIILPEEFYAGSSYNFTSIPEELGTSKAISELGQIAKEKRCYIAGGVTCALKEERTGDKRYHNIGFVIDRDGRLLGYQERQHIFQKESKYITPGDKIEVFNLDFGKVGIVMGVDILYPEITRQMAAKGAQLIITPSLLPDTAEENEHSDLIIRQAKQCAIARGFENRVFVAWVNGVGESTSVEGEYKGKSMITGPLGILREFEEEEDSGIVICNLNQIKKAEKLCPII